MQFIRYMEALMHFLSVFYMPETTLKKHWHVTLRYLQD